MIDRIRKLKQQRNAVILAHNYQVPEIQDVADYVGDSLGLAYHARDTAADVILFCGVHFMAVVVAYINCTAAVKAQTDVICTSGNAVKVVNSIPKGKRILFVPDQNLGQWVMAQTGRELILWPGACHVHVLFTHKAVSQLRQQHPAAQIVAHPECLAAVRMLADEVCSTEKMISYCRTSPATEFIIVTEVGMLHRLRKEVPGKTFIAGPTDTCNCSECPYMKKNTLANTLAALENMAPEIILPEEIRRRALIPIERMLSIGR